MKFEIETNPLIDSVKSRRGFLAVLAWQCLIYATAFLDIPVARQVIAFAYLAYVPGLILLAVLGMRELQPEEELLYSVGLSIAFLMALGVMTNELLPIFGVLRPLSQLPVIAVVNAVLLMMSYFWPPRSVIVDRLPGAHLKSGLLLIPIVVGITGILSLDLLGTNFLIVLLVLIVSCAILVIGSGIRTFDSKCYALLIVAISIGLSFGLSGNLTSQFIHGPGDNPLEYQAYQLVQANSRWFSASVPSSDINFFPTYSMMSVTILPTLFSSFLGTGGELLFNTLATFLVSLVPLGAYLFFRTQTNDKNSFLAALLLITIATGKGLGPIKQMIASLFFVTLFLVMLDARLKGNKKLVLLALLSFALVVSHYSLSYIFLYIILFGWIVSRILRKTGGISLSFVMIFSALCLSWYIFVTGSATFDNIINVLTILRTKATSDFFNIQSRGGAAEGIGFLATSSLVNRISSVFFYIAEVLIVLGFLSAILKKKNAHLNWLYVIFASANMSILLLNVLVPGLADTFLMARFFAATLLVIAPLFVIGGEAVFQIIPRLKNRTTIAGAFIIAELISLFLFQTGFAYWISGQHTESIIGINNWGVTNLYLGTSDYYDINGAKWLGAHMNKLPTIYSDWPAKDFVLTAYGVTDRNYVQIILNVTETVPPGSYIYLTDFNNRVGIMLATYAYNVTDLSRFLNESNQIFSNGNCTIYYFPGRP